MHPGPFARERKCRAVPERVSRASGPPRDQTRTPMGRGSPHQELTQVLPKVGLSSPTTEIALPHTFTGT